ncbi:unnamed protein product [Mytilus coruscus]|uniref:Uncharacterized protein n=1 Tax=Mytilus coruscus TaxID=42192 RepID=A0A6J8BGR5_MYTCO|nr:unnamed protein product [Mytilus coruscus]
MILKSGNILPSLERTQQELEAHNEARTDRQTKLENYYKSKGLGCLQDFINSKPVIHILFHLRHKNIQCCVDSTNCVNHGPLPLNYSQWDLLYIEKPTPGFHHCHCKYSAKVVTLDDLDISLASLILLNCCNLPPNEISLISDLRQFKNNYLSHNTKGTITQAEYTTLWGDLTKYVLQLDPSKQDDFIRIQNRSLDNSLCNKYVVCLLDIHQKLEEISDKLESSTAEILTAMDINNDQIKVELLTKLEFISGIKQQHLIQQYQLGQSIFTLHHQTDLKSIVGEYTRGTVTDILMMDDGRLVVCLPHQYILLICNTHTSYVDKIDVHGGPFSVTAVNNSTVAVTLRWRQCIDMYDINNKSKLKSISVPGMRCFGITTINNKLAVGGKYCILIIGDLQTGEVVQTIHTDCDPGRLHGSGDRIFYCDLLNNKLYWYNYSEDSHQTLTLPSPPWRMTTLQDDSLYVVCSDGSVQHVSSDGEKLKSIEAFQSPPYCSDIQYILTQRKLVIKQDTLLKIFNKM